MSSNAPSDPEAALAGAGRQYAHAAEAADFLSRRLPGGARIGIVLGSGLGALADRLADPVVVRYADVPHWPVPGVVGHAGRLVAGRIGGRPVVVLSGRVHAYEGHGPEAVTFAVRVLGLLGTRVLILTNAAGGVNAAFAPGTLMVIDDHLNLTGWNPLVGTNEPRFGPRFPDMTEVYSLRLRRLADRVASRLGITLAHGVYAALLGPSYETPAEIRYLRTIGADAVGMSTVPEAIVARHMGIEVLGISCITNAAAGVLPEPLRHEDVMETAARASAQFIALVEAIVAELPEG